MRRLHLYLYQICIRLFDFILVHTLRSRYRRISNQKIRTAYHYKFYSYLIERYRHVNVPLEENKGPIWFFWWQGENSMPPMVKKCYELAFVHASDEHPLKLLTKDNYKQYADIPYYIIEKLNKKYMSLTHFSDILRVTLLSTHGGLWMDSTLYSTSSFGLNIFNKDFFSVRTPDDGEYVSRCLWTGFFMGGVKGHPLFCFMRDLFFDYWKEHDTLIDYFMIDLGIVMAYDSLPQIKRSIDNGVLYTDKLHKLMPIMSEPIDIVLFNSYINEWPYYKMTWRIVPPVALPDGQETVYSYMLNKKYD